MVNRTAADISDSAGAQAIIATVRKRRPSLKHLFADGAYDRTRLMDAAAYQDFLLEFIRPSDKEPGFKVLPKRWVVERTFGWMTRWKRLVLEGGAHDLLIQPIPEAHDLRPGKGTKHLK